eukprot:3118171-Prymnesium_polylepis.1
MDMDMDMTMVVQVPMLNPDGVFLGNYRCNSLGLDLNRLWHTPVETVAPTIHRVRDMLLFYSKHPMCRLNLFVDVHTHSTCMNGFVFANVPEDPRDLDAVAAFPRALANHSPTFAFSGTKYCADPAKAGTGRRALAEMLPSVHCYTLEVSFFCSANGNIRGEAYTPASYTDMGQSMALALHEYYSGLETPTDASWHKDLQAPGQVIMASRQTGSSAIQLRFPVHEGACIEPDTQASRQQ